MWKNSLKNVESDNNKNSNETLFDFLQRNGTYFLSLVLSVYLRLGFPSALFPSDFPTKTLYAHVLSSIRAACPAHLIRLDLITRIIIFEEYRSLSSSHSFLHSLVTSSLLGPNILLRTLFSNTLRSSLNMSDHVSHPYKTIGRIIAVCVLDFG